MKAVSFIEENHNNDAGDLPCFVHDEGVIACWKMTFGERVKALFTGRVWVSIIGQSVPPMLLTTKLPFRRFRVVVDPAAERMANSGMSPHAPEGSQNEL